MAGRHARRSPRIYRLLIPFMVAIVLLLASFLWTPNASADYVGTRWRDTKICIQTTVDDPTIRKAIVAAAADIRENTVLHLAAYGSSDCKSAGYTQVINAVDGWYGKDWHIGLTSYTGGYNWAYTPNVRKSTWILESPVTVKFNQSKTHLTARDWAHVVTHELGHAVGLAHVTRTCASVMTTRTDCAFGYTRTGWWDQVGNSTYPGINVVYSW